MTFEIKYKDFVNNMSADTVVNVTGSLLTTQGTRRILVKAVDDYVEITNG